MRITKQRWRKKKEEENDEYMFHLVSQLVGLGESNIYQNLKDFTRIGDSCYRVDVTFHKINKFFNSKFYFLLGRYIDYTVSSNLLMVLFPISKYCCIKDFWHCIIKYCWKVSLFITWYKDSLELFWGTINFNI